MVETEQSIVPVEAIAQSILVIRGQRVILDADLARLYGVETRTFNQAVRRNMDRFPEDFMFRLTVGEYENLRSQIVISSSNEWGGRRYTPYAFTEHGAVMAATILKSPVAVEASVYVVRAFIRLRELLYAHAELSQKLTELESRVDNHDSDIALLLEAIRQLLSMPEAPERRLGYRLKEEQSPYVVNRKN